MKRKSPVPRPDLSERPAQYDHTAIESKWQKAWTKSKIYGTSEDPKKQKYYILDMFPYPSGEGLHVGHPKGYIATDVVSRFQRMNGKSVLHPMGFDAFGLPAENYALKTRTHPEIAVKKNVARYKKQLEILGFDYDWSREVNTTDPEYYKWTQWIFLQLLKKGLAFESYEPINWCPVDKTGLANEDIENGRCERCGALVEKKLLRQWVLKITDYADRLLEDLDAVEYEMPKLIDKVNPHQPGKPLVTRHVAHAVVYDPRNEKYLIIRNKKFGWDTVVIGGIEGDEDAATTARREVKEETGYTDLEFKRLLGGQTEAHYYAKHKGENRIAFAQAVYFELKSDARIPIADGEDADNEILWIDENDFAPGKMVNSELGIWLERIKDPKRGWPKPLLDWPESIKELQRNWIGRSEGALIKFEILNPKSEGNSKFEIQNIEVFTTRPDTLFGVTYVVLSPEHKLVNKLLPMVENKAEVEAYVEQVKNKTEIERMDATKEKTGVELKGVKAINPANSEEVPVWIADYVLADYGTGAVMAVPAHDERDFAFAKKFNLPIKQVVKKSQGETALPFTSEGIIVNSEKFPWMNGLLSTDAKQEMVEELEHLGSAKMKIVYKLRDWVFSRQRYWGEPIPVIHCELHGAVPVPEKDLPVKLPKVKSYEPTGTGESPLAAISKWVNVKCPQCMADKKKMKYFIFDFDGVLGDTWDAAVEAQIRMGIFSDDGSGTNRPSTNKDEAAASLRAYFSKKPHHSRDHTLTKEQLLANFKWTARFGDEMSKIEFGLFKGFIKEVKKYKDTKFAAVSSGSRQYVVKALEKAGLKLTHILAYEDHHSKEEKIERICKDWKVGVKDIYYFTDTKADVYELENLLDRKKIIGCSWGYQGYEGLKEVLPEKQILKDFKDIDRFFNVDCTGRRETNTMPQWAGSSWYYLRFEDPENKKAFVGPKKEKYWSPVDLYVGGAEHATRHLIYARFWHKFLYDQGLVSGIEPFKKLQHVGLIMGEDGRKMSKRFGNVVNPDDIVKAFGADTLRIYEMFMGPFDQQISWSTESMIGPRRFIERVWKLRNTVIDTVHVTENRVIIDRVINKAIKKVTSDIKDLKFNTAVSSLMIAVNEVEGYKITANDYAILLKLLAPFAPHVADELWSSLGNKKSIHISPWPVFDPALAVDDEANIVLQVNGKMRATFTAPMNSSREDLEAKAKATPEAKKWLENKKIIKVIVVPNKLVNIVAVDAATA